MRTSRHAWEVGATSLSTETGAILPLAYCTQLKGKQITASGNGVAENSIGTATATCPAGYRAVSGGFDSPGFDLNGGGHVLTLTSLRLGDNAGRRAAPTPIRRRRFPGQLVAYAYCLKGRPRITTVSVDTTVGAGDPVYVDVFCPARTRALSVVLNSHISVWPNGLSAAGTIELLPAQPKNRLASDCDRRGRRPGARQLICLLRAQAAGSESHQGLTN